MTQAVIGNYEFNAPEEEIIAGEVSESKVPEFYYNELVSDIKSKILSYQTCTNPLLNVTTLAQEVAKYFKNHPEVSPKILSELTDNDVNKLTEKVRFRQKAIEANYCLDKNNLFIKKNQEYIPISGFDRRAKEITLEDGSVVAFDNLPDIKYVELVNEVLVPEFMETFVAKNAEKYNNLRAKAKAEVIAALKNLDNLLEKEPIETSSAGNQIKPKTNLVSKIKSYLSRNKNSKFNYIKMANTCDVITQLKEIEFKQGISMLQDIKAGKMPAEKYQETILAEQISISPGLVKTAVKSADELRGILSAIRVVKKGIAETNKAYNALERKMITYDNFKEQAKRIGLRNALRAHESFEVIDDVIKNELYFLPADVKKKLYFESSIDLSCDYLNNPTLTRKSLRNKVFETVDELIKGDSKVSSLQLAELNSVSNSFGERNDVYDLLSNAASEKEVKAPIVDLSAITQQIIEVGATGYPELIQTIFDVYSKEGIKGVNKYFQDKRNFKNN